MQNSFLEFGIRENIKHAQSVLYGLENVRADITDSPIGGIFRDGLLGWIVVGSHIEIVSLKNGNRIAEYTFGDRRYVNTFIAFVTEVKIDQISSSLLVIGVQCSPTNTFIYLFAVDGSRIIQSIEIEEKLTSCCFIESQICSESALNLFDGCIVVGTETGKVIIADLFVENCVSVLNGLEFFNNEPKLCKIVSSSLPVKSIKEEKCLADHEGIGFGVKLDDLGNSGSILSILCLKSILVIAVGFEDGKMLLYDLCTMDAFHIAHPPEADSPLEKLTYIEPADDPRACVYLWSFHSNTRNAIAVLHSLTYERKSIKPNGNGFVYKNFERCTSRLTMPIFEKSSKPISCQSITKFVAAEENFLTLCLLTWTSVSGAYVCVFDLNQWYKQQMPDNCDWRSSPTYLAIFPLGKQNVLDVWMNCDTVTPFSSLNRPEEHFFPSSLSFDCTLLTTSGSAKLHWLGLQNEALEHLNHSGPYAILEPNRCFAEMVRASLIPQFTDYSYDMNQSLKSKREFLLSIALEYNCINLLRKCAIAWADGSHLSKEPLDGLSLSTLTDWIWNRAVSIKECCNEMCATLFDFSGNSIEPRSQKILLNFSRQLKRLFQLMDMIVTTCQQYIPGQALDTLQSQRNSICMATEYQEVLQWLLNMGLLPEVNSIQQRSLPEYHDSSCDEFQAIPYPYKTLKNYYTTQRRKFSELDANLILPKTKSCRILYIDAFIENECNSSILRSEWRKGMGDGLYPPASLQAMLRTLLVPGVTIERKYMLFVYLFMDLSTVLRDERCSSAIKNLIKFPAVFKMDPGLIKITQAFWNLDHGEFESAIDEIISPLAQDQSMSIWQRELLIEALILNDVPHLALRALHAPGSPISPSLEIRALLANDLIADAFQVQRMKRSSELLFEFFHGCHEQRKWHYLLNLSLNQIEEECLGQFLQSIESSLGENIHFLYLLRRAKYLEAITLIDELQQKKRTQQLYLDTPNIILSTYRLTMDPATRQFSDLYYSVKDNINLQLNRRAKYPKPLSSRLSQRKLDLLGSVYHQSLVQTEQTSAVYWEKQKNKMCGLAPSNVPFLHGLRVDPSTNDSFEDNVCYPEPFVANQKRLLHEHLEDSYEAPVAKRYRFDNTKSKINSALLTSFKETPKKPLKHSEEPDNTIDMDDESNLLLTTLSTPIVKCHREMNVKKSSSLLEGIGTPQSILKAHRITRGKSISSIASRRSVDSDRSIRFNLPNDCIEIDSVATSTPTVPDVFKFGITHRPSIHQESSSLKMSSIDKETNSQTSKANPSEVNGATKVQGRKRLRSISPDQTSNVTKCIDVSVEHSYELKCRTHSLSSEELNNEEINLDQGSESSNQMTSKPLQYLTDAENSQLRRNSTLPMSHSFANITSSAFGQLTPIERINEIEKRHADIRSELLRFSSSLHSSQLAPKNDVVNKTEDKTIEGNRIASRASISSIRLFGKNLLTDTTCELSSTLNENNILNESSVLQMKNIFSDSNRSRQSTLGKPDGSKLEEIEIENETEAAQIADSDYSSTMHGISENVQAKLEKDKAIEESASVEKDNCRFKYSTPLTFNISQFEDKCDNTSLSISPLLLPKNVLTESTLNTTSYYQNSALHESLPFNAKNILSDSSNQKRDITDQLLVNQSTHGLIIENVITEDVKKSTENTTVANIEEAGGRPNLINVTKIPDQMCHMSGSTSPPFDVVNSFDIYDVSSEVDVTHRDEEYDVEDYESHSEVIDISSGTDESSHSINRMVVSQNQMPIDGILSRSPSTTIHIIDQYTVTSSLKIDAVEATTNENQQPTEVKLMNESKCSEVSFTTASGDSINELKISENADVIDVLNADETKASNVIELITVDNGLNKLVANIGKNADIVSENQYGVMELAENVEIEETGNNQLGTTKSDFNRALVHCKNDDLTKKLCGQSQPIPTSPEIKDTVLGSNRQDIISLQPDTRPVIVTELLRDTKEILTSTTILKQEEEIMASDEVLLDENKLAITCDLNDAVLNDSSEATISKNRSETVVEVSLDENPAALVTFDLSEPVLRESSVDTEMTPYSDAVLMDQIQSTSSTCDLNKRVLHKSSQLTTVGNNQPTLPSDHSAFACDLNKVIIDESSTPAVRSQPVLSSDASNRTLIDSDKTVVTSVVPQQMDKIGEEINTDIDEILTSAAPLELQKNIKKDKEDAKNKATVYNVNTTIAFEPKRRLRSNSLDAHNETAQNTSLRKRTGSFTAGRNSPVLRSSKLEVNPTQSDSLLRAKLERTSAGEISDLRKIRASRAKSETKAIQGVSVLRDTRAKSEAPITSATTAVSPVIRLTTRKSRTKITPLSEEASLEIEINKVNKSTFETIPSGNEISADSSGSTKILVDKSPENTPESVEDDNVSVASEGSTETNRSLRSTRSTRSQSKVHDIASTTPKSSRTKRKMLPVIVEDLPNEDESEQFNLEEKRLTRAQRAIMTRAAAMSKPIAPTTIYQQRKRRTSTTEVEDDGSDAESVYSGKTNISAKSRRSIESVPVRKSKRLMEKEGSVSNVSVGSVESDRESISSAATTNSTRRRSKGSTTPKK